MSPDILLFLMFAAYALPIAFVYSKYQNSATRSISSIITSQEPFISIADNNAHPSPWSTLFKQGTFSLRVCC